MGGKPILILRLGLAFVFLANSLVGFFNPSDFKEIIEKSFFQGVLQTVPFFITLVAINDLAVSVFLFTHLIPKVVFRWALTWLIIVTIVIASSGGWNVVDGLEHLGFISSALVLMLTEK